MLHEWCILASYIFRLRQLLLFGDWDVKIVQMAHFVTTVAVNISDGIIKGSAKILLVAGLCSRAFSSAVV